MKLGDYEGAAANITAAMKLSDSPGLLAGRVAAYEAGGHTDLAAQDYTTVRAKIAKDPLMLNNLCWDQAVANVALKRALSDCDASLALRKDAPTYDSRGFVLYRLGRNADAVGAYDLALNANPKLAASLYGRGLAKIAMGDATGKADIEAALDISPFIARQFADMGIARPAS